MFVSHLIFRYWFGNQLSKRKELLYNLGAIYSYSSMLIYLCHGIEMIVSKEPPKHTLVLYTGSSFFPILAMAPYKWDKKWMRIKTSIGILVFGVSLIIFLICASIFRLRCRYRGFILLANSIIFLCSRPGTERALEYWVFPYCNLTV